MLPSSLCEPLRVWRDLPRVRAEAAAAAAESSTARAISSESDSWRYRALHWRLKNADAHAQHAARSAAAIQPPAPVDPYSFSIRDHRWVPPPSYRDYYRRGAWCEDAFVRAPCYSCAPARPSIDPNAGYNRGYRDAMRARLGAGEAPTAPSALYVTPPAPAPHPRATCTSCALYPRLYASLELPAHSDAAHSSLVLRAVRSLHSHTTDDTDGTRAALIGALISDLQAHEELRLRGARQVPASWAGVGVDCGYLNGPPGPWM